MAGSIRVGLARTEPGYGDVAPPYHPAKAYPELADLLGETPAAPPNPAYAGVRAALFAAGLDASRFDTPDWNPLGALVARGGRVVLKPNFIRHWNPCDEGSLASVITHGAVLRAVADYAFLAAGAEGSVVLAEAPQHDCDWDAVLAATGCRELAGFYERTLGRELELVDLRRECVRYEDGVIVERRALSGDPQGYRVVDLGQRSAFEGSGLDPRRFRGADYDPGPTAEHHLAGRNEYLLSETVLSADLVVNLPKLKTHKKTGVTLALKNLVGINGDKNWLPHHCAGSVAEGGDEFPGGRTVDRLRSRATDWARGPLQRGAGTRLFRLARRLERAARGEDFVRAGNWHGNRTTWRMCLDLNRCLYYSDAGGFHPDAAGPARTVLTVLDGIVAGEAEGPLAPRDVALGAVLAATDPVALDLTALRLMGFDAERVPKVREAMADETLRVTAIRDPGDVEVVEVDAAGGAAHRRRLEDIPAAHAFAAHPGWRGWIEDESEERGERRA